MVGNNDDSRPKYHGKRRNAFVGVNLKYYRPQNRYKNEETNKSTQEGGTSRGLHDRVGSSGNIKHRLSRFPSQSKFKYRLNRNVDKEGDELMRKNEGTSADLTRKISNSDQYRIRNFKSKPKKIEEKLAIGEKENSIKPLLQIQSFCKLKYIDDNVFQLIVKFLQQYFMCFDSNRQDLLAAYHKNALFSLSLNVNSESTHQTTKFGSYFKESRNMIYVTGNERLYKMLHSGNLDVVAFLTKMPKTEHDSNSLKLDSCFFMPNMITFSVTGVFKEGESDLKIRPYRSFQRVFVCIPTQNQQMMIVNEQYMISNLSLSQTKIYKEQIEVVTKQPEILKMESNQVLDPVLAEISDPVQQKMVLEFSKFSKLTLKWSKDCLEFSGWNYEQATNAFISHKNAIPKEAFLS